MNLMASKDALLGEWSPTCSYPRHVATGFISKVSKFHNDWIGSPYPELPYSIHAVGIEPVKGVSMDPHPR